MTVGKWRRRFVQDRVEGLRDELRPGAPRTIDDARIEAAIIITLESLPKDATHWSSRVAKESGLSVSSVQRIWRAFGWQLHRIGTFKLSTDRISGPRCAMWSASTSRRLSMVLCVDEKSQIQALDRSQPMLPMRPGQPARRCHDYTRHGTTSLFAALVHCDGQGHRQMLCPSPRRRVPQAPRRDRGRRPTRSQCPSHHGQLRHAQGPADPQLARQTATWHVHLTPTSSSWLNQVERFFAPITDKKIRRGTYRSVQALLQTLWTSSVITMPIPSRSNGPNPPTISSLRSSASAVTIQAQAS
nr:helix-turn-helix domain-containing protein [Bradyrhizobium brasilense]